MSNKITPTVGRVVLIFFAAAASGAMEGYALPITSDTPVPGLITRVHSDSCINVAAFDANGANLPLMSVRLLQEGDERPTSGCWAEWMPYQVGQAKKHADGPKAAAMTQCAGQIIGTGARDESYVRAQALEMGLRTPGLSGQQDVIDAASAYHEFIKNGDLGITCAAAAHVPSNAAWTPNLKPGDGTPV